MVLEEIGIECLVFANRGARTPTARCVYRQVGAIAIVFWRVGILMRLSHSMESRHPVVKSQGNRFTDPRLRSE